MDKMQTKSLSLDCVEIKYSDEIPGRFTGYASAFNGLDSYGDTVVPGAFKKTIKKRERPILMRWNHYGPVIGKWLNITEDEKGLMVEGELTLGHSVADDVYASMKHGAISGMSIGYIPTKTEDVTEDGKVIRKLKEIELVEISIVEQPADLGAKIGDVKSLIDEALTLKEIERVLRDAGGFSRTDATALVSRIKSIARSECDAETSVTKTIADQIKQISNRIKGE